MSFKEYGLGCPCGKSSDAYGIDENDWGHCFSCGKNFDERKKVEDTTLGELKVYQKPIRGLTESTVKDYGIMIKGVDGVDHFIGYEWPNGAVKVRDLLTDDKRKRFVWHKNDKGEPGKGLYGMDKFPAGSKPSVTITEGEADAPSVYQASGKNTAGVSVSSSSSAYNEIRENIEYLNSFRKIILCLDSDEPGQKNIERIMSLFQDKSKVFVCVLKKYKDANDYLVNGEISILAAEWASAVKYSSDSFIHTFVEVAESLTESVHDVVGTYPIPSLQEALRGPVRGEMVVWKGLEGIGKTEMFRMIEHHLLVNHPDIKIGVVHMEEDKATTIKGVATYVDKRPMYFEEDGVTQEEILDAYKKAVGTEDRFFIYKITGGEDPDEILASIRNLVTSSGVDIIFLDNLQKMVDSLEEADERQKLVYLASKLKAMAMELKISLQVISHVNDDGKALGSRYTTKVADKVVHMNRDITTEDMAEKFRTYLSVEKGRMARGSGKMGYVTFNPYTFCLELE